MVLPRKVLPSFSLHPHPLPPVNIRALPACVVLALAAPGYSQTHSWETDTHPPAHEFGNTLVFGDGALDMSVTSWSHTRGRKNLAFEAGKSVVYSTGLGVTNRDEGPRIPEHQIDNGRGNEWVLIIFDAPVEDVKIIVDPYGVWDRDVTYYTANLSGPVDLEGLTYSDLADLGFGSRTDDLSIRSGAAREVEIQGDGAGFNAVLIGAHLGKQGFRGVDRFKIGGVSAVTAVPEPSAAMLGFIGALGLLRRRREAG